MKLVAGHLTLKNGRYYAVLNYRNAGGQRKTKWIALGLPEKGNKRKAEAELAKLRAEFEPPKEVGDLSSDMLFADYLLEWLEIAGTGSPTFADVLFRNAQKGKTEYGHPLSRDYPLGAEICGQDRYADPECGGQSGPAQKKQLSAGFPFGRGNAEDV